MGGDKASRLAAAFRFPGLGRNIKRPKRPQSGSIHIFDGRETH